MEGAYLRFYVYEGERVHGLLLWEWLLQKAREIGIRGGTAFKAMAGFGHRHRLHDERFFELAGSQPVEVEFVVSTEERARLLEAVEAVGLPVFYAEIPARFGSLGPQPGERAARPA